MDDAQRDALARLALRNPRTAAQWLARVQAIAQLWAEFDFPPGSGPLAKIRAALQAVIDKPGLDESYQGSRAVSMAVRLLADIDQRRAAQYPTSTPDALAPAGYWWPYCCTPAHHGQGPWRELDAGDTQGHRDAWRVELEGNPPWQHPPDEAAAA